jgi:hypothetical protein
VNHVLILTNWLPALTWHSQTGNKLPNIPTSSLVVASLVRRRNISHELLSNAHMHLSLFRLQSN